MKIVPSSMSVIAQKEKKDFKKILWTARGLSSTIRHVLSVKLFVIRYNCQINLDNDVQFHIIGQTIKKLVSNITNSKKMDQRKLTPKSCVQYNSWNLFCFPKDQCRHVYSYCGILMWAFYCCKKSSKKAFRNLCRFQFLIERFFWS